MSQPHSNRQAMNEKDETLPIASADIPKQWRDELEGGPLLAAIRRVEESDQDMSQVTHSSHNKKHHTNQW